MKHDHDKDREFYRYELNIPVWLEIEPDIGEPQRERCNIINISQKGIQFESKNDYEKDKKLGVRFFLPSFGVHRWRGEPDVFLDFLGVPS